MRLQQTAKKVLIFWKRDAKSAASLNYISSPKFELEKGVHFFLFFAITIFSGINKIKKEKEV